MTKAARDQLEVWKRFEKFRRLGMRESYLILYNSWLVMDYVLMEETYFNEYFLTSDFLE